MAKNLVGELILQGKTTEQIQNQIMDFPTNPTAEYLMKLGYKESTAVNYICKLKRNNLPNQGDDQKTILAKNERKIRGSFICSKNANKDNLILDTCALQNRDTIKIIDESSKVTILLSTLNEMEELKRKKSNLTGRETFLQTMISKYGKKFLKETEKYRLVPFIGDNYNDTSILEYLRQQPVNERQTIITADILFANRASCLGFDYILYDREEEIEVNQVKSQEPEIKSREEIKVDAKNDENQIKKEKEDEISDLGVKMIFQKEKIFIKKYNYNAEVFYLKEGKCECISGEEAEIDNDVDYIAVVTSSKYGYVKVVKEVVNNSKFEKEEYKCFNINEIYQSEAKLHDDILECCKKLLL